MIYLKNHFVVKNKSRQLYQDGSFYVIFAFISVFADRPAKVFMLQYLLQMY